MGEFDHNQVREVSHGYYYDAERRRDFLEYIFDIEYPGEHDEVFERFEKWQQKQLNKKNVKKESIHDLGA